jgi:hypothetical protein
MYAVVVCCVRQLKKDFATALLTLEQELKGEPEREEK